MSTKVTQGTTATSCECCAALPCVVVSLLCRSRGGTATLCGYDEYTSPSTPPKKYRTRTLSGSLAWCYEQNGGGFCNGVTTGGFRIDYSGSCVYDASTCIPTVGGSAHIFGFDTSCAPDGSDTPIVGCGVTGADPSVTVTLGQLTRTVTGTGLCATDVYRKATGTATETLSVEDTESAAINRLLSGAGGVWSAYGASLTCGASWEQRTTSFSFLYFEGEFKGTAIGLTPNTDYRTFVDIFRRHYGSGSYTLFATMEISGTSDSSGNFEVGPIQVPNAKGFQTYATPAACPP